MARPISDEELQLKKRARRRLVGAIVLVTAIAVVLPMILDSEPQPVSQNVDIQIPSPDAGEFKPKSAAAPADADKSAKAAPEPDKRGDSASAEPVSPIAEPPATRSEKTASAKPAATEKNGGSPDAAARPSVERPSAPKETAPSKSASSAASGAYVVQVAALSDAAKAKQLEKRMAATGLKTYTEVVTTASGRVTRVRAGPYSSRDAAEKARTQLKKAGFDGQVMAK